MMLVICTRLRPGHLSVRVGDGSRRSEEIIKNLVLRLGIRLLLNGLSHCVQICGYDWQCTHIYAGRGGGGGGGRNNSVVCRDSCPA